MLKVMGKEYSNYASKHILDQIVTRTKGGLIFGFQ
jgi:hypothetical protein